MRGPQFIILAVLLLGGLYVADRVYLQKRGIASFEGRAETSGRAALFDLTELSEKEFYKAYKGALIQGLQVKKAGASVGLAWGQFLDKNDSGGKVYACEKYPYVEMVLQAEGVAYSGNVPTLVIRGPCVSSDDGQSILPFMIPMPGLFKNLKENNVYRLPMPGSSESFILSAQYLYSEWPRYWNVVSFKLANDSTHLMMDGYEIISLLDRPLTLDFAEGQ
jgi:hypothetical protein